LAGNELIKRIKMVSGRKEVTMFISAISADIIPNGIISAPRVRI